MRHPDIRHAAKLISLLLCLALCQGAAAGKLSVKSADPPEGYQGTELDVTISGTGFGPDAEAFFWREETADPGDIVVEDTIYVRSSQLIAKIRILSSDLPEDFEDYDIEVLSGGRRGKGTTLFRVREPEPPPSEEDLSFRWLPAADYGGDTAAEEDLARGPCTTPQALPHNGNYFCPHRIWPEAIRFDFSGVPPVQTKKNGEAGLCAAMDAITLVANAMYTVAWEDGPCKGPEGCEVYVLQWFVSDEFQDIEALVAEASGVTRPAVDMVKIKTTMRAFLSDHHDANPLANDRDFAMHTAVVQFIKSGTNHDAAVCVYDFGGSGKPLVLETNTLTAP